MSNKIMLAIERLADLGWEYSNTPDTVRLHPQLERRLRVELNPLRLPTTAPISHISTPVGEIRVVVDPLMPLGEVRIYNRGVQELRIINLAHDQYTVRGDDGMVDREGV